MEWILRAGHPTCDWSLNSFQATDTLPALLGLTSLQHASLEAATNNHTGFSLPVALYWKTLRFNFLCMFTFRNNVMILPQWIPLASWSLENRRSRALTRAYATRLLLLSSHTNMSGTVCWGCSERVVRNTYTHYKFLKNTHSECPVPPPQGSVVSEWVLLHHAAFLWYHQISSSCLLRIGPLLS